MDPQMLAALGADPTAIASAQAAAQDLTRGFNVDGDVAVAAVLASGSAFPGGPSAQIQAFDLPLFHRVDYLAAGQTSLSFFNAAESEGITNLPQAGQIPAQTVFALEAITLDVYPGMQSDGTYVVGGGEGSSTAIVAVDEAEKWRHALISGTFELTLNGRSVYKITGLHKLPSSAGLDTAGWGGPTTGGAAFFNNGIAHVGNMRRVTKRPHLLPGGMSLKARVTWPVKVLVAQAACMEVNLWGTSYFK